VQICIRFLFFCYLWTKYFDDVAFYIWLFQNIIVGVGRFYAPALAFPLLAFLSIE
jgi:hypothetical protein